MISLCCDAEVLKVNEDGIEIEVCKECGQRCEIKNEQRT